MCIFTIFLLTTALIVFYTMHDNKSLLLSNPSLGIDVGHSSGWMPFFATCLLFTESMLSLRITRVAEENKYGGKSESHEQTPFHIFLNDFTPLLTILLVVTGNTIISYAAYIPIGNTLVVGIVVTVCFLTRIAGTTILRLENMTRSRCLLVLGVWIKSLLVALPFLYFQTTVPATNYPIGPGGVLVTSLFMSFVIATPKILLRTAQHEFLVRIVTLGLIILALSLSRLCTYLILLALELSIVAGSVVHIEATFGGFFYLYFVFLANWSVLGRERFLYKGQLQPLRH
jgi:hypothetical protein